MDLFKDYKLTEEEIEKLNAETYKKLIETKLSDSPEDKRKSDYIDKILSPVLKFSKRKGVNKDTTDFNIMLMRSLLIIEMDEGNLTIDPELIVKKRLKKKTMESKCIGYEPCKEKNTWICRESCPCFEQVNK